MKTMLMGNEAMALGAIRAGVKLVTGYPGTPSTEVLETIAKQKALGNTDAYVEWSVNEKAALEVAAGAAYCGARTLVTMKQVGLNVASDPLMSLAYVGVKGGMVVLVADDPGPISSQTEQDTRRFAQFSKLPVFDPATLEEAYLMIADAFDLSEKYSTPVIFRPTTRICHATASIELLDDSTPKEAEGFIKSPDWVIFPKLSYNAHKRIEKRNPEIGKELSGYRFNTIEGEGEKGIVVSGVSAQYAKEALELIGGNAKILTVATVHPFPADLALYFMNGLKEILVYEELDPVIEDELLKLCGQTYGHIPIKGKHTGSTPCAGENSVENAKDVLSAFLGIKTEKTKQPTTTPLPVRPPTLCAGCPHRASFYAVKKAMKGKKAVFAGDIGCYTLGNAAPLNMTDTCLCMGAGITIAQGIKRIEPDTICFSFTGDSTFFHTGLPGIANAVYNGAKTVCVILDNSTTAMTGQQPNPSTGFAATGEAAQILDIEKIVKALGVKHVETVDPFDQAEAVRAAKEAAEYDGVSCIIYKSPCIAVSKPKPSLIINKEKCVGCKRCASETGCPALIKSSDNKIGIDSSLCYGCGLCENVCGFAAITKGEE